MFEADRIPRHGSTKKLALIAAIARHTF